MAWAPRVLVQAINPDLEIAKLSAGKATNLRQVPGCQTLNSAVALLIAPSLVLFAARVSARQEAPGHQTIPAPEKPKTAALFQTWKRLPIILWEYPRLGRPSQPRIPAGSLTSSLQNACLPLLRSHTSLVWERGSSQGVWAMAVVNTVIAICAALFLVWVFTDSRSPADKLLIQKAATAARNDMANANASLPKWDDKNYKGLTHRP
jgi:hypothetical protein